MIGKGDPVRHGLPLRAFTLPLTHYLLPLIAQGYFLTSKMIVESALCIIDSYDKLPPLARMGGPLTPATAFGEVLVERLRRTEWFDFTVE